MDREMERQEAIDFLSAAAWDGSERERFAAIVLKLLACMARCSDEQE